MPCLTNIRALAVRVLAALFVLAIFGGVQLGFSASTKPVHVHQYTKKDGTVVAAHDRANPSAKATTKAPPAPPPLSAAEIKRRADGRIARSTAAKRSFEAGHPCPATGKNAGACPGYVIDHVKPLACGGEDAASNMAWQTIEEGKTKDRTERVGCSSR